MNDLERLTRLAEDTLAYNRVVRSGCFVGNAAADELGACGPAALPVIEQLITERVVPDSRDVADHHALMSRFPGLMSVWMTYFTLARQADVAGAADFVGELNDTVLASAALAVAVVWHKTHWEDLPPALSTLLLEVAGRSSGLAAEVVRQRLLQVWGRSV